MESTKSASGSAATVVQLSDEALALAARALPVASAGEQSADSAGGDEQGSVPASRSQALQHFARAHDPPSEGRLIDARA